MILDQSRRAGLLLPSCTDPQAEEGSDLGIISLGSEAGRIQIVTRVLASQIG